MCNACTDFPLFFFFVSDTSHLFLRLECWQALPLRRRAQPRQLPDPESLRARRRDHVSHGVLLTADNNEALAPAHTFGLELSHSLFQLVLGLNVAFVCPPVGAKLPRVHPRGH